MVCTLKMEKSKRKTWDPGSWDPGPGTLRPGISSPESLGPGTLWPWDLGPWDPRNGTLGLRTFNPGPWDPIPGTLVMGPCDPVTWTPPQTVLTLFVKQISKGHGMCVKNVGARIQKQNLGIFSSHFCFKRMLTLYPIHIFVAFVTCSVKVVA